MDDQTNKIGQATPLNWNLTESQQLNYQALYLLYLISEDKVQFPNFLTGKLRFVEKAMVFLDEQGLISPVEEFDEKKVLGFKIGQEVKFVYRASEEAKKLVSSYRERFLQFIKLHDVYAYVDPEQGTFAFNKYKKKQLKKNGEDIWKKYLDNNRWVDYRVPVAIYKGMDPREFVFFSFMEEGRFIPSAADTEHQWAEDIFMGTIWNEMYQVLESAPIWEEQGSAEDSSAEIIETIIIEGAKVLKSQRKKLRLFIAEQERILELDDSVQEFAGEENEDDHYFDDPIYYEQYHYRPLTDPLFWLTAAIII